MAWTALKSGNYVGKTLPQVLLTDPSWFYLVYKKGYTKDWGKFAKEADEIYKKSRAIKIPHNEDNNLMIEYGYSQSTEKFIGMEVVSSTQEAHRGTTLTTRKSLIDLAMFLLRIGTDKMGGRIIIACFKAIIFNGDVRLTKNRCEQFFPITTILVSR